MASIRDMRVNIAGAGRESDSATRVFQSGPISLDTVNFARRVNLSIKGSVERAVRAAERLKALRERPAGLP
jgi:hypothetical protein